MSLNEDDARSYISSVYPYLQTADLDEVYESIRNTQSDTDEYNLPINLVEAVLSQVDEEPTYEISTQFSMNFAGNVDEDFAVSLMEFPQEYNINEEENLAIFRQLNVEPEVNHQASAFELHLRTALLLNENSIEPHQCGRMSSVCKYCGALHFEGERNSKKLFNSCCHSGEPF
jgi:hypothetical protein